MSIIGSAYQLGIRLTAEGAEVASDKIAGIEKTVKKLAGAMAGALSVGEFVAWMKTAVDAGDEMKAFSQKTGVAVKDVAGLQLAFKQGGVEGDALTSAMGKLSKNMLEGSEAFDKLGIKTRNSDGSLRSVKDVLYDVADATAAMGDGAQKSGELQAILGKSAQDLIPTLNDGSDGLRRMAQMADALGLSMSSEAADAADGFNDTVELLGMSMQGVARQTMAQLLPTMNRLTGVFLETLTEGDALRKVSDSLAAAMKLLFSSGLFVVEVFNVIGKTIGAAGAQIVAVMSGDFKGAAQIGQEYAKDVKTSWNSTATSIAKVWSESGDSTVTALGKVVKSQRELGLQTAAQTKTQETAAAAAKKHSEELDKLAASMRAESAGLSGDFFAKWQKLNDLRSSGRISVRELESAQARLLAQQPAMVAANKEQADAQKVTMEALGALTTAELKEADTIAALVEKQREHNATIGLTKEQLALLELAKIDDALATAEQRLQDALKLKTDAAVLDAITLQVEGLRELKQLKKEGVITQATVDTAKQAAEAWGKTIDDVGRGLTDSLFRAFESGKGFFSTLWDGVKNTIKTTSLKVLIQPVQGAITGLLGMGSGGAMAGGQGLAQSMSQLSSFWDAGKGWLTDFGGSVSGVVSNLGGNLYDAGFKDIGNFLGDYSSAIGDFAGMAGDAMGYFGALKSAADGKWGAAAGSAIGTYFGGPVGAAIGNAIGGLADKIFSGGAGTPHRGAMYLSDSTGGYVPGASVVGDMAWGDSVYKNRDQGVEDVLKLMTGSSAGILNRLSGLFGGAKDFRVGGYWSADNHDPSQGNTRVWRGDTILSSTSSRFASDGKVGLEQYTSEFAGQIKAALGVIDMPGWAKKQVDALAAGATLDQMAQTVAAISATQLALRGVADFMAPLGGVFGRVAGLSADATLQLAGFAGGMDALIGKTKGFIELYYSDNEKNAISAGAIRRALQEAGIAVDLGSKDDLKALIQATDINNEAGLKQLAVLLDVAASFAPLGDYLKAQGLTLNQLAAQAPQVALLTTLQTKSEAQVNYQAATVDGLGKLDGTFVSVGGQITAGLTAIVDAVESGLSQVTNATNATRRVFERFDDGDALTVKVVPT